MLNDININYSQFVIRYGIEIVTFKWYNINIEGAPFNNKIVYLIE